MFDREVKSYLKSSKFWKYWKKLEYVLVSWKLLYFSLTEIFRRILISKLLSTNYTLGSRFSKSNRYLRNIEGILEGSSFKPTQPNRMLKNFIGWRKANHFDWFIKSRYWKNFKKIMRARAITLKPFSVKFVT